MLGIKPAGPVLAAITLAVGGLIAATAAGARASDTTLCHYQVARVSGGAYTVQNDEWDSSAAECVATDRGADFTVVKSAIANSADGPPGGYPSIFAGCHYGDCTKGGLGTHPLLLSQIARYHVTSSWDVTTPGSGGNVYDVAYDLWINQTRTTSGAPNGTEIMVWLRNQGPVRPAGAVVASGVWIGGCQYDVWYRAAASGSAEIVTYQMTRQRAEVTSLSIGTLVSDAELRGYTRPAWYLISVEAGFEIWRGGTGLATRSFSVRLTKEVSPLYRR